jgi:tripartite-type tricarboxylate transporter receptor subunit TctC
MRRRILMGGMSIAGLIGLGPARQAGAQARYPERPVRLVVAFAPGGFTDIVARLVAAKLSETLGQQVIIDNKAGAGGIIGTEVAAKALPDGYTLLLGTISTHAMNPHLYAKLPYDPVKDFAPVARIANSPNILVVHPSVPAKSVAELIALAKAKPGDLKYGSGGNGTSSHLAGEMFKAMAGVDIQHIPYRSTSNAATALLADEISLMFDTLPSSLPHVRAGKLRALAVTVAERVPSVPELPTVAGSGLPGFEMGVWVGLFAPAGTPQPVIARLDAEAKALLALPEIATRFDELGLTPFYAPPEGLAAYLREENDKWGRVIRGADIRIE